jgi:DNA gyrase subunit B
VVKKAMRFERILDVVERHQKNRQVVATLAADERMTPAVLADTATLTQLLSDVATAVRQTSPEVQPLTIEMTDDPEHACHAIVARTRMNGSSQQTVVDMKFCLTPEFEELRRLAKDLRAAGRPPFVVVGGEKQMDTRTLREAVGHVITQARKGLDIQRYKGLGEMNPEQLWQTTMNPETRTLLQVKIEDAYEADDIFSTLMGDAVEPRRKFIEENALNVKNLDI